MELQNGILLSLYGEGEKRKAFESRLERLLEKFKERFGIDPTDGFSSPGRIEICGNHTDHNNGKVVVGAIDCDMLMVAKKSDKVRIISEGFPEIVLDISDLEYNIAERGTSLALVKGVMKGFVDRGFSVGGFDGVMNSTVFLGAGVSSSAAYELLICQVLNHYYNGGKIDEITLAKIGQYAENVYFGKPCGLLDQSGIAMGGITKIDFCDPEKPIAEKLGDNLAGLSVILVNTGNHENLTDEYSAIRSEMGEVASFFGKTVLREVDRREVLQALPKLKEKVSGRAILRALHYYDENDRVDILVDAVKNKNIDKILTVINESGLSSATLLQNTYPSGDKTQGIPLALSVAKACFGSIASRVHGGGFAGTAIIFARPEQKGDIIKVMSDVFGKENVFDANIRQFGACKL